jgi:hypothetical protein
MSVEESFVEKYNDSLEKNHISWKRSKTIEIVAKICKHFAYVV